MIIIIFILMLRIGCSIIKIPTEKKILWERKCIKYNREKSFNLENLLPGIYNISFEHEQRPERIRLLYGLINFDFPNIFGTPPVNIYFLPEREFYKFTDMTKKVLNRKVILDDVKEKDPGEIIILTGNTAHKIESKKFYTTVFGDFESFTESISAGFGSIPDKGFDAEWLNEYLAEPSEMIGTKKNYLIEITEPYVMIYHTAERIETKINLTMYDNKS